MSKAWVVTLGKHRLLAGASWSMLLSEQGKAQKAEMDSLLLAGKSHFGATYAPAGVSYPAFAVVPPGAKRNGLGLIPAAAWFAASVTSTTVWVGAAPTQGHVWLLAARNGVLDLRSDQTMVPEKAVEIVDALSREAAHQGGVCHVLHAPEVTRFWEAGSAAAGITSRAVSLEKLLVGLPNKAWAVRKYAGVPSWALPAAVAVAGLAVVGYVGVTGYAKVVALRAEANREASGAADASMALLLNQQRAQEQERARKVAAEAAMRAATATPDPLTMIESCRKARSVVPAYLAGWRRVALTCGRDGRVDAQYEDGAPKLSEASSFAFREAAQAEGFDVAPSEWGKDGGSIWRMIDDWPTPRPALVFAALPDKAMVNDWLSAERKRLQSMGLAVSIGAPAAPPSSTPNAPPTIALQQADLVVAGSRFIALKALSSVTYMSVDRIEITGRPGNETWTVFARLVMR